MMPTPKTRFERVSGMLEDARMADEAAVDALTLALIADGCEVIEMTAAEADAKLDAMLRKAGR